MSNLTMTGDALQQVLISTAEEEARRSGFLKRASKLTASHFVQALVFGWMGNPQASASELAQTAAVAGVEITPQGLNSRMSDAGLSLLRSVFQEAVRHLISGKQTPLPLLERFSAVRLFDATTISLPKELAVEYPGCGDRHGSSAGMKLHVCFDMCRGSIQGAEISAARLSDVRAALVTLPLEPGSLVLWDLGYFSLDRFTAFSEQGVYWLSRLKGGRQLFDANGLLIDLPGMLKDRQELDMAVTIGQKHLQGRLLATRVSQQQAEKRRRQLRRTAQRHGSTPSKAALQLCSYTIVITNLPAEMLTLDEAMTLLRVRWQVEILFKLFKSHGQIDEWRSKRPVAILCEFYAKLIGVLLAHWIMLAGAWSFADRSILKAATAIGHGAMMLAAALRDAQSLLTVLAVLVKAQSIGCRLDRRKKHPSTFQRLDACSSA